MFNKQEKKVAEDKNSSNNNIIGKGTLLEGSIETFGNIRIEGKVIGNIKTKSKAALGPSAQVEGSILSQNGEIEGHVVGTLEVADVLVLKSTAVIDGDIVTNKLIVESGAVFNGSCKMGVKSKEIQIGKHEEKQLLKAQS